MVYAQINIGKSGTPSKKSGPPNRMEISSEKNKKTIIAIMPGRIRQAENEHEKEERTTKEMR